MPLKLIIESLQHQSYFITEDQKKNDTRYFTSEDHRYKIKLTKIKSNALLDKKDLLYEFFEFKLSSVKTDCNNARTQIYLSECFDIKIFETDKEKFKDVQYDSLGISKASNLMNYLIKVFNLVMYKPSVAYKNYIKFANRALTETQSKTSYLTFIEIRVHLLIRFAI